MIKQAYLQGTTDALQRFGLEKLAAAAVPTPSPQPGFWSRQHSALKSLGANVRGAVGGAHNPEILKVLGPDAALPANASALPGIHRQEAWSNAKTLLPSAGIAAAGLYGAHKLLGKSDEEKRRAAQLRMMGVG